MANADPGRRLPPDARRGLLLEAARSCLIERGMTALTLELVAEKAGVTAPLLRHYFGSRDGLLITVTDQVIADVMNAFSGPLEPGDLPGRLDAYLDVIAANPWVHAIWMHAIIIHPDIERIVTNARRRLAAYSFAERWETMTTERQLAASGWVGYVEAVIADWIAGGLTQRSTVLATLATAATRLNVVA